MSQHDIASKIQRADKHFQDFYEALSAFVNSDPCGIVPERDPQTNRVIYRVAHDVIVPVELALIAGDVLQNLRTALDYLACSLVLANDGKVTTGTGYPILPFDPSSPEFEPAFTRKVKGMREDAKRLILESNPYKGGNDFLWRLHELNRREKHRLLFTVGGFINNWSITQHIDATNPPLDVMERLGRAYLSQEVWTHVRMESFPLKAGDPIFVDFPNAKVNKQIKFGVQVAIDEPGLCEAEPLLGVLYASIGYVKWLVKQFAGMY